MSVFLCWEIPLLNHRLMILFSVNDVKMTGYAILYYIVEFNKKKFSWTCLSCRMPVDAIMTIKFEYGIKKNWTNDPCFPSNLVWNGVRCSTGSDNTMRIISLWVLSGRTSSMHNYDIQVLPFLHVGLHENCHAGISRTATCMDQYLITSHC